ncbi:MAG: hypothetical protein HYZ53_03995 [Planctomycetes bacterium]|nr:hypothetical protein [Planctomycetota bacterium]
MRPARARRPAPAFVLVSALLATPVLACLWDYDTLRMERRRFPSALELITGKFLRHSKEFYAWRVEDRRKKLAANPGDPALLDDLAVALEKTGEHEKAIETLLPQAEKTPDRYETMANLGTFHLHAGRFDKGLEYIEQAIKINPQAHFGRELYQKLLVEYVQDPGRREDVVNRDRKPGPLTLPLSLAERGRFGHGPSFAHFVLEKRGLGERDEAGQSEMKAAIGGVLGMMKFGTHDAPVLLEALGDLLMCAPGYDDAKQLAARAFLRAARGAEEPAAKTAYREMAGRALQMQTSGRGEEKQLRLEQLEKDFELELADAAAWYDGVKQDELRWLREGADPEAEFARKYYSEPEALNTSPWWPFSRLETEGYALFGLAIFAVVAKVVSDVRRLRRQAREQAQEQRKRR